LDDLSFVQKVVGVLPPPLVAIPRIPTTPPVQGCWLTISVKAAKTRAWVTSEK
jgi:hypothetical protein